VVDGVTVVVVSASLTVEPLSVEETLQAFACAGVTVARSRDVHVVAAVAQLTTAAGLLWVTVVVVRTHVTP